MITPLIMLALMAGPWLLAKGWERLAGRAVDARAAAAIGLGMMFVFTGIGHFAMTDAMVQMLPAWVPARLWLVYATGILEFLIALGLFLPRTRRVAGWAAAAVLVLFFPANVYAAFNHVPMGGHAWGPVYLLVRVPLQTAALLWSWWFTIRQPPAVQAAAHSESESDQSLFGRSKMSRLDKEEQEILDAFDAGELQRASDVKGRKARHQRYAEEMFKKDARINIRLSSKDLRGLQKKALAEGIPYQTLVASILHKYVEGRLHEDR